MIAFGPVPSRRLGRSLGINNIPPKVCTYSCVYCQLGRTMKMQVDRRAFYQPEEILRNVKEKVERAGEVGESIDYLTFVPDGEPTLDAHLGREIELLKTGGIALGVVAGARSDDHVVHLRPGDCAVFYTDGVTEAMSPEGHLYGMQQLEETVQRTTSRGAQHLLQVIDRSVAAHASTAPASDDLTLIILQRLVDGRTATIAPSTP